MEWRKGDVGGREEKKGRQEKRVVIKLEWKRRYAKCTETHERQAVNEKSTRKRVRERPRALW